MQVSKQVSLRNCSDKYQMNGLETLKQLPTSFSDNDNPAAVEPMGKQEENLRFHLAFQKFFRNTTFHGVRYIVESKYLPRRLMWIAAVLVCVGAVGYQIYDRVNFYLDWPVNVNFQVIFNQSLIFPAVTICNQNAFRASKATYFGCYCMLESIYSEDGANAGHVNMTSDSTKCHPDNLTMEDLYTHLGHRKEDLIVWCQWNNRACGPEDFSTVLTDHGLCYTFKGTKTTNVSSSGVQSGLRLTMNTEQYEYMPGPHDSAGVKVLFHHPNEFPLVHGFGQSIPTGSHAFADLRLSIIKILPDHGACSYKELEYGVSGHYTTGACHTDCLTRLAATECGCRDVYMPNVNGYPPICTIKMYYSCLKNLVEKFNTNHKKKCKCPVPCRLDEFVPLMSYATVSNLYARKLLTRKRIQTLQKPLIDASEVTSRVESNNCELFTALISNVVGPFSRLHNLLAKNIARAIAKQIEFADITKRNLEKVYNEKNWMNEYQKYNVERNFIRPTETREEWTLHNVALGYNEFLVLLTTRIQRLAATNMNEVAKDQLFQLINETISSRKYIVIQAIKHISSIYESYEKGKPLATYKFEDIPRSHNNYMVPKPLLYYSITCNYYAKRYIPRINLHLGKLPGILDNISENALDAYRNNTTQESILTKNIQEARDKIENYLFTKNILFNVAVPKPLAILRRNQTDFDRLLDNFKTSYETLKQNILSFRDSCQDVQTLSIPTLQDMLNEAQRYCADARKMKIDLVDLFLSYNTSKAKRHINLFFRELQTRGQNIYDDWTLLLSDTKEFWKPVINDENMFDYYKFTNKTEFLVNITEKFEELELAFAAIRDRFDVRHIVSNGYEVELFKELEKLTEHLRDYNHSLKINEMFLKENFLRLDVFYRELSYEQMTQQAAYDFFALVCDIGGSMGLFIGASMLTVLEVVDLLTQVKLTSRKCCRKRKCHCCNQ